MCESVIKFIIGVKDAFKVHKNMEVCGVREHLWLKRDPHNPSKIFQPIVSYVLKPDELKTFIGRLGALKVPSDYCSVVGKHVMDKKLGNMKSHDWHVLMQQFMCRNPTLAKCEDETHTPKVGDLESSGTPECSEFDSRAQNTSH